MSGSVSWKVAAKRMDMMNENWVAGIRVVTVIVARPEINGVRTKLIAGISKITCS